MNWAPVTIFSSNAVEQGDVYSVKWKAKPSIQERLMFIGHGERGAERGPAGRVAAQQLASDR